MTWCLLFAQPMNNYTEIILISFAYNLIIIWQKHIVMPATSLAQLVCGDVEFEWKTALMKVWLWCVQTLRFYHPIRLCFTLFYYKDVSGVMTISLVQFLGGVASRVQSHGGLVGVLFPWGDHRKSVPALYHQAPNYMEILFWRVSLPFHITVHAFCVVYKTLLFVCVRANTNAPVNWIPGRGGGAGLGRETRCFC